MLGPHSSASSGSPKSSSVLVAGYYPVGRSLAGGHGKIDQIPDIWLGVGDQLGRLRIPHQGCRRLGQARIESSKYGEFISLEQAEGIMTHLGRCLTCR